MNTHIITNLGIKLIKKFQNLSKKCSKLSKNDYICLNSNVIVKIDKKNFIKIFHAASIELEFFIKCQNNCLFFFARSCFNGFTFIYFRSSNRPNRFHYRTWSKSNVEECYCQFRPNWPKISHTEIHSWLV